MHYVLENIKVEGVAYDWRHHRQKAKAYKTSLACKPFVVDNDDIMEKVSSLCTCALVGRLEYFHLDKKGWVDWIAKT